MKKYISTASIAILAMTTNISLADDGDLLDIFNVGTTLENTTVEFNFLTNNPGQITGISGNVNGETAIFSSTNPFINDDGSSLGLGTISLDTTAGSNKGTLNITSSSGDIIGANAGDTLSIQGTLDTIAIDVTLIRPDENGNSASGELYGHNYTIKLDAGKTIEGFDLDNDNVNLYKGDQLLYSGLLADIDKVKAASILANFEVVNQGQLATLTSQGTSIQTVTSLVSSGISDRSGLGIFTNSGGLGGFFSAPASSGSSSTSDDTDSITNSYRNSSAGASGFSASANRLKYGGWTLGGYNYNKVENNIGTFKSHSFSGLAGGHLVLDEIYLAGLALGYQNVDVNMDGVNSGSDSSAFVASPYFAARLMDGAIVPELTLIYSDINLETTRASTITGKTDGKRMGGRAGLSYNAKINEQLALKTSSGIMAGYDEYDAFTESDGTSVDKIKAGVAILDAGITASYSYTDTLEFFAGINAKLDLSDDILKEAIVSEFGNSGVELNAGTTFIASPNMKLNLNSVVSMGENKAFGYGGSLSAQFSF